MVDSDQGPSSSSRAEKTLQSQTHSDDPTQYDSPATSPTPSPQTPHEEHRVEQPAQSTQDSAEGRAELVSRARTFLTSPQVQHQDIAAKRAFLVEKGLSELEIAKLLSDIPTLMPTIPPKTYPQPRPSNLPVLLLGLARLFSWLAGGSAFLLLIYHRVLLPRITRTSLARHSLRFHHLSLLRQLTTSLSSLKESQSESLSVLPRPDPSNERKPFSTCTSVEDVLKIIEETTKGPDFSQIPHITLLRCAIQTLSKDKEGRRVNPTTDQLYRYLETQIPWLLTEEGFHYESQLWETLSTSTLFGKVSPSDVSNAQQDAIEQTSAQTHWGYITPSRVDDPPLFKSLIKLSSELPRGTKTRKSPFQHTLQSLSDFTGYISTQIYLPYRPPSTVGIPTAGGQNSLEEDLRKEIRALKGLVLNRRSFMPTTGRYSAIPSTVARPSP